MLNGIVTFLNEYLDKDAVSDAGWNGLQVEGHPDVRCAMFAVDAGMETFARAVHTKADLIVVHHGLFWKSANPSVTGWTRERIDLLLRNGISLYASHLPLDRHPQIGNNAQILKSLGASITGEFLFQDRRNVGWTGALDQSRSLARIVDVLNTGLATQCTVLAFGREEIRTLAVASGGTGIGDFHEAVRAGVDVYITGETSEIYHAAKDARVNVVFAGHHASEILGVKALSEVVQSRFGISTSFVDIPTGL